MLIQYHIKTVTKHHLYNLAYNLYYDTVVKNIDMYLDKRFLKYGPLNFVQNAPTRDDQTSRVFRKMILSSFEK